MKANSDNFQYEGFFYVKDEGVFFSWERRQSALFSQIFKEFSRVFFRELLSTDFTDYKDFFM